MACNVYQKNNKTSVIYIYKATSVLRQEMETDSNPIFWKKWHFHTEITKPQRQMESLELTRQTIFGNLGYKATSFWDKEKKQLHGLSPVCWRQSPRMYHGPLQLEALHFVVSCCIISLRRIINILASVASPLIHTSLPLPSSQCLKHYLEKFISWAFSHKPCILQ